MSDVRLIAARKRLSESRDEEDAVEGLREIVANLLGSEEIGLFRLDHKSGIFQACWSFGIDLEHYNLREALGDAGLEHLKRGECHINLGGGDSQGAKGKAFVPIRVDKQTIAILGIFRLLPQKLAFDGSDMELFKFLSDEAAKPLFGPRAFSAAQSQGPGMRA